MVLLPNKEYSQRFLDELNCIGCGFLGSAVDFIIDETDKDLLSQRLEDYFPSYLVAVDADRCLELMKTLHDWLNDDYYHPITRLQEYILMRAIHNEWAFFNDLPEDESLKLRDAFYCISEKSKLSQDELAKIYDMKGGEISTLRAFFDDINFGEIELISAFYQEATTTFLRF